MFPASGSRLEGGAGDHILLLLQGSDSCLNYPALKEPNQSLKPAAERELEQRGSPTPCPHPRAGVLTPLGAEAAGGWGEVVTQLKPEA